MKSMIDKKEKMFITEISEEDFRKLDLKVKANERVQIDERSHRFEMVEKSMNDILDKEIKYLLENGYASDLEELSVPVTVAIAKDGQFYLDKFMNRYSGAQTYQLGLGIKHIYSTRDYFECGKSEDYWRVLKRETKAIYRVHLDEKRRKKFVLKHKSEVSFYFPDHNSEFLHAHYVIDNYDLDEETGEWKYKNSTEVEHFSEQGTSFKPYNKKEKGEKTHDC